MPSGVLLCDTAAYICGEQRAGCQDKRTGAVRQSVVVRAFSFAVTELRHARATSSWESRSIY